MPNVANAAVWIAAVLLVAFCVLVATSAWLKGSSAFLATVLTLFAVFGVLAVDTVSKESGLPLALSLSMYLLLSGMFFYLVAGRYLTQTPLHDMTYQSHTALIGCIEDNAISSPLATLLRKLGPALLVCVLVFGLAALWAKSSGAVT